MSKKLLHLPPGWQYCNGSDITEGPWTGGKTPDLNGPGLFLRGGDEDSVLDTEEGQLQDHQHVDSGHSHSCTASSTAEPHYHESWKGPTSSSSNTNAGTYHSSTNENIGDYISTLPTTVLVNTTCDLGSEVSSNIGGVDSTGANSGEETRPANMRVIYIIRVY